MEKSSTSAASCFKMKLFLNFLVFFIGLAVCQNATKQEQLARALELLQTMPECAVSHGGLHASLE